MWSCTPGTSQAKRFTTAHTGKRARWHGCFNSSPNAYVHSFFLSSQAIYILALNLTCDATANKLEYWLQLIRARAGATPPVLLVGTHADAPSVDQSQLDQFVAAFHVRVLSFHALLFRVGVILFLAHAGPLRCPAFKCHWRVSCQFCIWLWCQVCIHTPW